MRKSVIVAAAAGLLACGSAQALLIPIDDFNSPDMVVIDQLGGGATVVPSPGLLPNGRIVSHELLVGANDLTGDGSKVTIGTASFPTGTLEVKNGILRNSEVKVSWTIAAGLVPTTAAGAASMVITVIKSDANPTDLELFVNGLSQGDFFIPGNTTNVTNYFVLSAAAQNALASGGMMELVINGDEAWDMAVDSLGIQVPEPSSVALVGLALVAGGLASRRRKV